MCTACQQTKSHDPQVSPQRAAQVPSVVNEPKIKGVAFRSVLAAAGELRGQAFVEALLRGGLREHEEVFRYKMVQTGWYPISLYRSLWAAIIAESGEGHSLVRTLGAAAVRRDVTGVYRLLFSVLSVETVLSLSSKVFSNYYDHGSLRTEKVRPGFVRAFYENCAGFDRAMWEELVGAGEELMRLAGGKGPRMRIVRVGEDRGLSCEMTLEWT